MVQPWGCSGGTDTLVDDFRTRFQRWFQRGFREVSEGQTLLVLHNKELRMETFLQCLDSHDGMILTHAPDFQ
jgi:hypothetical protein